MKLVNETIYMHKESGRIYLFLSNTLKIIDQDYRITEEYLVSIDGPVSGQIAWENVIGNLVRIGKL